MSRAEKSKQIFNHRQEKTEVVVTVAAKLACNKDKAVAEGQQNTQQNVKAFLKVISLLIKHVSSH